MKNILIMESLIVLLFEQLTKAKSRGDIFTAESIERLITELEKQIDNERAE